MRLIKCQAQFPVISSVCGYHTRSLSSPFLFCSPSGRAGPLKPTQARPISSHSLEYPPTPLPIILLPYLSCPVALNVYLILILFYYLFSILAPPSPPPLPFSDPSFPITMLPELSWIMRKKEKKGREKKPNMGKKESVFELSQLQQHWWHFLWWNKEGRGNTFTTRMMTLYQRCERTERSTSSLDMCRLCHVRAATVCMHCLHSCTYSSVVWCAWCIVCIAGCIVNIMFHIYFLLTFDFRTS